MLTVTICGILFFIVFYRVHKKKCLPRLRKLIPQPLCVKTCLGDPLPWGSVGVSLLSPLPPIPMPGPPASDSEVPFWFQPR